MEQLTNLRLAVLIDAENVPHSSIKGVLEEVAVYGTPTIKRIYGDWTNHSIEGWKKPMLENAITPIQQYSYTVGKNSSDSAMIIDAMDILYTEKTDGFVIVSSDSDFTRLAIRLRESGQLVIGIGERKTPNAFITACDKFTYIEVIRANRTAAKATSTKSAKVGAKTADTATKTAAKTAGAKDEPTAAKPSAPKPVPRDSGNSKAKTQKVPSDVIELIADSLEAISDNNDDECVSLSELGSLLRRKKPDFDCRNYGFGKLSTLIKSCDRFDIELREISGSGEKNPFVRDREA